MASRTLTNIRQLTAQQLGIPWPITGTADAGGSTTTLKDSILQIYNNDKLIGAHILLTSGSPTLTELLATDSVQSTGIVTFRPTLGGAPDSLTYEILPYSSTDFLRSIQDALLELYDRGLLVRKHLQYGVAGSPIYNADWSYWTSSTAVDGWTRGTSTLARERASGNVLTPTSVALSSSAGTLTLDARWRQFLMDLRGKTATLYCPVKTSTGSSARLNFYNGDNNYSAYHGGGGNWEILHQQVDISETASDLYPQLVHDGGGTDYFGMPWVWGLVDAELPFPLNLLPEGPSIVQQFDRVINENNIATERGTSDLRQLGHGRNVTTRFLTHRDEATSTDLGLLIPEGVLRGQFLQLEGDGPLNSPSANTDEVEVNTMESLLIATKAAILLLERDMGGTSLTSQRIKLQKLGDLNRNFNRLSEGIGQVRDVAALPSRW